MKIIAEKLGKKFTRQWIFRDFDLHFELGKSYAVTGNNGSGKSTLLKVLSGQTPPTEGRVSTVKSGVEIPSHYFFRYMSWSGPYTQLIEEFTGLEMFRFYSNFKPMTLSREAFFEELQLAGIDKKIIKDFSSGMQQKLKLALSLFSKCPVLFLDEPTTNLDKKNTDWYQEKIRKVKPHKLLIISSNLPLEYEQSDFIIDLRG